MLNEAGWNEQARVVLDSLKSHQEPYALKAIKELEKGVAKKIDTLSREDVSEPAQVIDMARLSQHNNLDDLT